MLGEQDELAWLPVDVVSSVVLELSRLSDGSKVVRSSAEVLPAKVNTTDGRSQLFYNVTNPRTLSWQRNVLPALSVAGLIFKVIPWHDWLDQMRKSGLDPEKNPGVQLLTFWEGKKVSMDSEQEVSSLETSGSKRKPWELKFDTQATEMVSITFRYMANILKADYLGQLVKGALEA